MSMSEERSGKIEIGAVISETFAVLGRNFAPFFLMSLILAGLPAAIMGFFNYEAAAAEGDVSGFSALRFVTGALASMAAGAVLQGALTHAAVMDLNGRRVSLSDSLTVGLRAFLPLIAIGIMMAVAVFAGIVLLIVPGVILGLAWWVVVPVYVVERKGVFFDVFGRSAELTRNNRWRLLGVALIFIAIAIGLAIVISIVGGIIAAVSGQMLLVNSVVISPVNSALSSLVGALLSAVTYFHLRRAKEGAGAEDLAAVFD